MAIALTYLERWPGAPRNAVSVIDRLGNIALTYAKVHTCEWDVESALTPGDDFDVCDLDMAGGTVKIGCMICFDREFPESARILMLKGAEVILTPNACGLEQHRIGQFKTRAYENMVGVAMANYAAPDENGHSVAYDGAAFDQDGRSRDTLIVEAGEAEGVYLATFDLDLLRGYRAREVWGDAFRQPRPIWLVDRSQAGGRAFRASPGDPVGRVHRMTRLPLVHRAAGFGRLAMFALLLPLCR